MDAAITFDHVSKRYQIGLRTAGLRDLVSHLRRREKTRYHWAVQDVSFALAPGESLGIVGPNGAGKTTILKLLSGVTRPTSGSIRVNGRFSALIELGAGFHPDLTGRENVFLNGAILGMKRDEIRSRFDRIVDFAGIEEFIDTPVKRYSSGMYARLGFAIAAHVDPDVLLVDEVLAVGDYAFRMKCYARMDELRAQGTSLIFVSHNMEDVRRVCRSGLVMYRGQKVFEGSAAEAVATYPKVLRQGASKSEKPAAVGASALSQRRMTHGATIERVELVGEDGRPRSVVGSGERVYAQVEVHFHEDAPSAVFAVALRGESGEVVYDTTTRLLGVATPSFRAGERALVRFKLDMHLLDGAYVMAADLAYADLSCYYDYVADALNLVVTGADQAKGVANLNAEVSFHAVAGAGAGAGAQPDGRGALAGESVTRG